jgi:hypothetical protein
MLTTKYKEYAFQAIPIVMAVIETAVIYLYQYYKTDQYGTKAMIMMAVVFVSAIEGNSVELLRMGRGGCTFSEFQDIVKLSMVLILGQGRYSFRGGGGDTELHP